MGGYRNDVEGTGGVSPSEVQMDHRDEGEVGGGWGVVISPGSGGTRIIGRTPHMWVHSKTVGYHCGTGGIPTHLLTLYLGIAEAGDKPDDEIVVSGRGTLIWGVYGDSAQFKIIE